MGEEASARILNAAHTILLHAVPDPELIVKAAGTRLVVESSLRHQDGPSTDLGSSRQQHQLRADANHVRRLREGICFVLGNGRAQKVQIAPTRSLEKNSVRKPDVFLQPEQELRSRPSVKVSWIREATRTGLLPCIKVGRQVRWTRPMLEQWLAQHQTRP
jgi:hypothetical protein